MEGLFDGPSCTTSFRSSVETVNPTNPRDQYPLILLFSLKVVFSTTSKKQNLCSLRGVYYVSHNGQPVYQSTWCGNRLSMEAKSMYNTVLSLLLHRQVISMPLLQVLATSTLIEGEKTKLCPGFTAKSFMLPNGCLLYYSSATIQVKGVRDRFYPTPLLLCTYS